MPKSPFSDAPESVCLRLAAGSPLAELFVIDHAFELVDRAIGQLEKRLEPGVYKVKAQLGEAIAERPIVLDRDKDVDLAPDLGIASPVPLPQTTRSHEYHMAAAMDMSRPAPPPEAAGGAAISILARRWDEQGRKGHELKAAWLSTVSLDRADGEGLLKLGRDQVRRDPGLDPCMAGAVDVAPGNYLLRWHDRAGLATEQAIYAASGWETEVFLLDDAPGGPAGTRTVRVSVLMTQSGFEPQDTTSQLIEEARGALADERRVASQEVCEQLFAKFENPMLGLFGAHLMLIARDALRERRTKRAARSRTRSKPAPVDFDQALYDHAVAKLFDLLGPRHPDVVALATQTTEPRLDEVGSLELPPMLWNSWDLLITASNDLPDLVPTATWLRAIRPAPVAPFLTWSPCDPEAAWREWVQAARERLGRGKDEDEEQFRRRLTSQALAPRAAIDDLLAQDGN